MNKRTKFIKVCAKTILMAIICATMLNSQQLFAAAHEIIIYTPYPDQQITDLYKTDYDYEIGTIDFPKNEITFHFKIINDDGYYITYDAFIDEYPDPQLNDLGWGTHIVHYNAKAFLQQYGRGTHTFTIKCYHGIPYTRPSFGLQEGDNPDNSEDIYWVDPNHGYILALADETSVTFQFNPPLCHFLGFGYTDEERWQGDILPLRDMLQDSSAHYLEGYFSTEFYWTPAMVENTIKTLDVYEEPQDIDIIIFSTHGTEEGMWDYNTEQVGQKDSDILAPDELTSILSCLDSQNLIVIIHACHSGTFLPSLSTLTNTKHIITTCQSWEIENDAPRTSTYDPLWSLEKKIKHVGPYILWRFYYYLYHSYDNFRSFQSARDDVENAHLAYNPVHICDLFDLILYVNIGG